MFDYLNKFNSLNSDLKLIVTSPQALEIIEKLEKEFNVNLASLIMKIMIKEVDVKQLPVIISAEFNLDPDRSKLLADKIIKNVLYLAADYLSLDLPKENQMLNEIILKLKLKFKDDNSRSRFLLILNKYIIGAKDRSVVREMLVSEVKKGELDLTDKIIDDIFTAVESIKRKEYSEVKSNLKVEDSVLRKIEKLGHGQISSKPRPKLLEDKEPVLELAPVKENFELENLPIINSEVKKDVLSPENLTNLLDNLKNISTKKEEEKVVVPEKPVIEEKKKEEIVVFEKPIIEEKNIEPETEKKEIPVVKPIDNRPLTNNGKVKMADIKKIKVTGPIDELKFMDLVNFRRLSNNPKEIFVKIKQKLEILKNIDYGKMLEGVKAWRQSPINKLYLKMFFKASDEGKSIIEVIEELKDSNQEYLTYEEVEALIEFNRNLLF
jgi:hypothetical protein